MKIIDPCNALETAGMITFGLTNNPKAPLDLLLQVWDQGMIGLVSEATHYAAPLAAIVENAVNDGYDMPGVFDYEVSEEFGAWFGEYILSARNGMPGQAEAFNQISAIARKFFECGARGDPDTSPEFRSYLEHLLQAVRDKYSWKTSV